MPALNVTTLHLAASKGYTGLATLLIGHGADVNARARTKGDVLTPLAFAIRAKQPKMEKLLRERGAV